MEVCVEENSERGSVGVEEKGRNSVGSQNSLPCARARASSFVTHNVLSLVQTRVVRKRKDEPG